MRASRRVSLHAANRDPRAEPSEVWDWRWGGRWYAARSKDRVAGRSGASHRLFPAPPPAKLSSHP